MKTSSPSHSLLRLLAPVCALLAVACPAPAITVAPTDIHVILLDSSGDDCHETGPPEVTCPPDITTCWPAPGLLPGVPTASTHCPLVSVDVSRSDGRQLSDPYPEGTTTITWTVTNKAGSAMCTQKVTLVHILVHGPAALPVGQMGTFTAAQGGSGSPSQSAGGGPYHWESSDPVDAPIDHTADNPPGLSQVARVTPRAVPAGPVTITATDSNGCSGSSTLLVMNAPPGAPTLMGMCGGPTQANLTWQPADNKATGFELQRKAGAGDYAAVGGGLGANAMAYQDLNLTAGATYAYRIRALSPAGPSPFSNEVVVRLVGPAAPTGLTATCTGSTTVMLRWTNNARDATEILVERSVGNGAWDTIAHLGPNAAIYADANLVPGVTYSYRVSARNLCGTSDPAGAMARPTPAPTNLRAICASPRRRTVDIQLNWDDNGGAKNWIVERLANGGWVPIVNAAGAGPAVTAFDTNLPPNTTYAYRVRAVGPCGPSDPSNAVTATTRPSGPKNLRATVVDETHIRLDWEDTNPTPPDGWIIERAISVKSPDPNKVIGSLPAEIADIPAGHGPFYDDKNVSPDLTYYYYVWAYNRCGRSFQDAFARATPPATPVEYDPGTPIKVKYDVPSPNSLSPRRNGSYSIGVSPGEQMIFGLECEDTDRRRKVGAANWTDIPGTGDYQITMTCNANAEFGTLSGPGGLAEVEYDGLRTGNVYLWIKNDWDGRTPVEVTATIRDYGIPIYPPSRGSTKDPEIVIRWRMVRRRKCPESMREVIPGNREPQWARIDPPREPQQGVYTYLFFPGPPPPRPIYNGETILETFGAPTALLMDNGAPYWGMDDLMPQWRMQYPLANTPDAVAAILWTGSNNSTFTIDSRDSITDQHTGFGATPFKLPALERGVGYTLPQQYRCGRGVVGRYLIDRLFRPVYGIHGFQFWETLVRKRPAG